MDYTNLVKIYYRTAINALNKYDTYLGSINEIKFEGVNSSDLFYKENNFPVLLPYDVNINAPSNVYEDILDYYVSTLPTLSLLLLGKKGLKVLYDSLLSNGLLENDQFSEQFIIEFVNANIQTLLESGVIK